MITPFIEITFLLRYFSLNCRSSAYLASFMKISIYLSKPFKILFNIAVNAS